jgi:predicted RNase H-like HicB family nuclease
MRRNVGDIRYTVIIEKEEDGGYHAFCPALPGCHTQGDDLDDALVNIEEAIELYVESLVEDGETVPDEDVTPESLLCRPV